jgi:cytidine deaminase
VTTTAPVDEFQDSPRDYGLEKHPLYFGVSRPIGTDSDHAVSALKSFLDEAGYFVVPLQVSQRIVDAVEYCFEKKLKIAPTGKRTYEDYTDLMSWGDVFRSRFDTGIAAKLVIRSIREGRDTHVLDALANDKQGIAYLITHLMHPDEVSTFRAVYGERFFLLGINAPRRARREYLASKVGSRNSKTSNPVRVFKTDVGEENPKNKASAVQPDALTRANTLIQIDAGVRSVVPGTDPSKRLSVDKTFQEADLFLIANAAGQKASKGTERPDNISASHVGRLIRQIFSDPFGTPSIEEHAMAAAFLAAKSSVALGRSVGAVLVDKEGSIVSSGWNEVASPGGGPYREVLDGSEFTKNRDPQRQGDHRDHVNGFDPSDLSRVDAIKSFLDVLFDSSRWENALDDMEARAPKTVEWLKWFREKLSGENVALSTEVIQGLSAIEAFANTRVMNLIEFGRSVHAEVAAISDAAQRGIATAGQKLYVTTFPCHECTRNLISFGIEQVVYVEPYGKSMAESLYGSEISIFGEGDGTSGERRVAFDPFVGISPNRLESLFSAVPRKRGLSDGESADGGGAIPWELKESHLRRSLVGYPVGYNSAIVNESIEQSLLSLEALVAAQTDVALDTFRSELRGTKNESSEK